MAAPRTSTYYRDIRPKLNTGDIVLFSGKGGISDGIKWFTGSDWSHVGMVFNIPQMNIVLLWESTTLSNLKDVLDKKAKRGVQLVPLKERVDTYKGAIAVRQLQVNRTPRMMEALLAFRGEVRDRPYEQSKLELIQSAYDGWLGENREDLSSLFCSELVAESYQRMGLLADQPPSAEYTPRDFASKSKHPLTLRLGARLGAEIKIRPDPQKRG